MKPIAIPSGSKMSNYSDLTSFDQTKRPMEPKLWFNTSIKCDAPDLDEVLSMCIEVIWKKYDLDGNGYLDKEETRSFIQEAIEEIDSYRDDDDEYQVTDAQF